MHLIKVNAISSTNSYARELFKEDPLMPATCIWAVRQLQGRGQRGTSWVSNAGQNLTFSIVCPRVDLSLSRQFLISAVVATTVVKELKKFSVPRLSVKWPNDIMAGSQKIGGILIENIVSEGILSASVIGIGLNVNQTNFEGLPAAGSMKLVTGHDFEPEEVLGRILDSLEVALNAVTDTRSEEILKEYKDHLFRYKVPSTFQLPDQTLFMGIIENVSLTGKLLVQTEEDQVREFDLKEIKLCY